MKTILLLITGAVLLIFILGALQTLEYCVNNALPVPCQVYAFLVVALIWSLIASRMPRSEWKRIDDVLKRLLNEDK